jgi:hypothetical protein
VLLKDGLFGIWDVSKSTRLSISTYLRARDLRAIAVDWIEQGAGAAALPIIAASDGSIRVVDKSLSLANSSVRFDFDDAQRALRRPVGVDETLAELFLPRVRAPAPAPPLLLDRRVAMDLKLLLLHWSHPELRDSVAGSRLALDYLHSIVASSLLPRSGLPHRLSRAAADVGALDTASRALVVAHHFGDLIEYRFWTIVLNSFEQFERTASSSSSSSSPLLIDAVDLSSPSSSSLPSNDAANIGDESDESSNDASEQFDYLQDGEAIKRQEMRKAHVAAQHLPKHARYAASQKIAWNYSIVGEKKRAINLLLQTAPDHVNFYADALKACVVAASVSPAEFSSTMLVCATNLIATDRLDEGVQMLVLIGRGLDACQHLQNRGLWQQAARIAKTSLSPADSAIVMMRWADHLLKQSSPARSLPDDATVDRDNKLRAIEIFVMLGEYHRALQLLHREALCGLATLLHQALVERFGVDVDLSQMREPIVYDQPPPELPPLPQLLESIHLDYAFFLQNTVEALTLADIYWRRAGEAGQRMRETLSLADKLGLSSSASSLPESNIVSGGSNNLFDSLFASTTHSPSLPSVDSLPSPNLLIDLH